MCTHNHLHTCTTPITAATVTTATTETTATTITITIITIPITAMNNNNTNNNDSSNNTIHYNTPGRNSSCKITIHEASFWTGYCAFDSNCNIDLDAGTVVTQEHWQKNTPMRYVKGTLSKRFSTNDMAMYIDFEPDDGGSSCYSDQNIILGTETDVPRVYLGGHDFYSASNEQAVVGGVETLVNCTTEHTCVCFTGATCRNTNVFAISEVLGVVER